MSIAEERKVFYGAKIQIEGVLGIDVILVNQDYYDAKTRRACGEIIEVIRDTSIITRHKRLMLSFRLKEGKLVYDSCTEYEEDDPDTGGGTIEL